ncbi:S53 family peptidase [Massilia sp. TN1-12]|uniref:S53 family peptidase n=1 Tax=Massilia paldalensis TaxID=3377675 RepID=UPI00384D781A
MKALSAIAVAVGLLAASLAQAATTSTQVNVSKNARAVDLGLAPQGEVRAITLSLAVRNLAALEAFVASTVDPASPNYRRFLTPEQVGAQYGQDAASVSQVVNFLKASGLAVTRVYKNNLLVSVQGTNAQLAAVFGSPIHRFSLAGQTYEAPLSTTAIPAQLAGVVKGVHGLSSRPLMKSNTVRRVNAGAAAAEGQVAPTKVPTPAAAATAEPGSYTTADLARQYNITPLYQAGIDGAGRTIGIATLADYRQSDAFAYWDSLGLATARNRITDVRVDGGASPGYGVGTEGAGETTLDVQQSGGVAPGADMRVYIAPNTEQGFIDVFAQPVDDNLVDTLSISWGSAEIANYPESMAALHTVFLQAAAQGIPVIAASGDAGAYDINRNYTYPDCTTLLSVDYPAADPIVLAAGGTTLPHVQPHLYGTITVSQERAWAWDYLRDYFVKNYGQAYYYANIFPVGGGGGVSVNFARPSYQANLAGVANSAAGQTLYCKNAFVGEPGNGVLDLIDMPGNYAGRNLPDVSLNADPYSGYSVYQEGMWGSGSGGTSFVSPQLNGIFTLISAGKGGRVGFLQPQLYGAFKARGYGAGSPFRAITAGTDFYYSSKASFNPATGLGTLDVANLARVLGVQF